MLYRIFAMLACLCAAILLIQGCGGSSNSSVSGGELASAAQDSGSDYTGDNPLIRKALSYDRRCYPAVDGFQVVPLADDFNQLAPRPAAACSWTENHTVIQA